jgi:protoporphyrinogen oxidase
MTAANPTPFAPAAPEAASAPGAPQSWGIVGGGMLGMMLAHRLAQAGRRVTLFEDADHLGGLADPWTIGDVVWDRHYHVTLLSDRYLRTLLGELGLDQEMEWTETRTGFYTDGKLVSMSNTLEFLRFPPLGLIDKFRLALTILYASRVKQWRKLEGVLVEDWLTRWSGRHTFERIWRPLLRSKLGEAYQQTSAAFIWATIDRLYEARRSGLKRELFGYVPGGYDRILKAFSRRLEEEGVRIRLKEGVRRVAPTADGRVGVETSSGSLERFDQVVITAPSPVAARVCPDLNAEEKARLLGIRYQGIVCASILLSQPLSQYYVTNITEPWVPYTGVIEMSTLVDRKHLGGHCLVYLPKYVAPDDPLFERTDDEIQESFLSALARMYPHFRRQHVLAFRVSRVRHVFALTTLNYSDGLPPLTTSLPGVHLVNSAHVLNGTLNVNATLRLAESAAQGLLSESRRAVLPAY